MSKLTLQQVMENTPKVFDADAAEGVEAVVQFHFTGAEASDWVMTIADGKCTTETGTHDDPRMTMTVDSDVYVGIIEGETNAMSAFMNGDIQLQGDMGLAMQFTNYFKMGG
jgi:putative sterol carrier protein